MIPRCHERGEVALSRALYRWFVGLGVDEAVWAPTVFTKNRDRLLEADVARKFLAELMDHNELRGLLSDEHFSVDGTQIAAWASMKSFRAKDGSDDPPGSGRNGERDFHGEKARIAAAHRIPFAACRVVIDPAHRELPPAAMVGLRHDGTPDVVAVFRSVLRRPRQLPALARTALDARTAEAALRRGRRLLGAGLGFPYFSSSHSKSK